MAEIVTYRSTDAFFDYIVHLADNSLIMGHRLSEWTGHGPMLEQDIAITNIALDLVGQSRYFYQYAAEIKNNTTPVLKDQARERVTEDSLAYLRDARQFKNILLTEVANGDWARTILKIFFFSAYQYLLYENLIHSADRQLSAIAEKTLKEVTYHVRWSSEWVIRLGDGTNESKERLQTAVSELWEYTDEMFVSADYEIECTRSNTAIEVITLRDDWNKKVAAIFSEATISFPAENNRVIRPAGKEGSHTKHLDDLLEEMQFLQRSYPGCEW